jgi:rhodanese-related sulfurtransferase
VTARLEALGLRRVDHDEAAALFRDPRYETEQVLFVDARNDAAYAEGHIPSAYQLDHYYPERYLAEVLPACQLAEVIVVYCTGGECEDSESTAVLLKNTGIPADRLRVYLGGIHEWAAKGMPQETGPRRSGILKAQGP